MSFVMGGYRALELLPPNHLQSVVQRYRGADLAAGRLVAMTVLDIDRADDVRSAVAGEELQHPHLLPVDEVVQDTERIAMICRWPAGGRLAELLARRQTLTVRETLTVLIPLAAALAALHDAGTRHGDIGPSNIWFEPAGRPLLSAFAVSGAVRAASNGMPSEIQDVAPEVVRGERSSAGSVTSAADVFSLGSVALRCLAGRPAWPAEDPADVLVQSAAGLWPDLSDDAGPQPFVTLVRAMLRADPARRPSAAEVAAGLGAVGVPEPVSLGPVRAAQSDRRWRGWGEPEAVPAGRQIASDPLRTDPGDMEAASDADENASDADGEPGGEPAGWARQPQAEVPSRPQQPSRLAKAGIAVLVGLLAAVVAVQVGMWWTGRDEPGTSFADQPAAASGSAAPDPAIDWMQVVTDLDGARARAFASADPAALTQVYLPQSAPALADAATIADLAARGWTVPDGAHVISSVAIDPAAKSAPAEPGAEAGAVRLIVLDSLPARPIIDTAGQQVGQTAARPQEQRTLTVILTPEGYRITAVDLG